MVLPELHNSCWTDQCIVADPSDLLSSPPPPPHQKKNKRNWGWREWTLQMKQVSGFKLFTEYNYCLNISRAFPRRNHHMGHHWGFEAWEFWNIWHSTALRKFSWVCTTSSKPEVYAKLLFWLVIQNMKRFYSVLWSDLNSSCSAH